MCRNQLRFIPSALTGLIVALALAACSPRPDDVVPATYPLRKGQTVNEPAIISVGLKEFTGIPVSNSQDRFLATLKTPRPIQITDYLNANLYTQRIITQVRDLDLPGYTFAWSSTNRKVMMLALFKQVIQVADNQIANPEDIVWLWTPPAGTTDPGKVTFGSGKLATYKNGQFILTDVPKTDPLPIGMYVWAVWAWDDKAINIVAATRELPFRVTGEP